MYNSMHRGGFRSEVVAALETLTPQQHREQLDQCFNIVASQVQLASFVV